MLRNPMLRKSAALLLAVLATGSLAACQTADSGGVDASVTATVASPPRASRAPGDPKDDLALGKEQYRARNYGLAELHFRRAVESAKSNPEAWLGLAASYDELKRFRLADRAYAYAFKITGPTAEFLNNRGYSYLMRGDLSRAFKDLTEAQGKDPENERIRNNLKALDARLRRRA
jgi:Flp pilus assembly protein TadD